MSRQFDTYIHSLLEPDHRNAPLGGGSIVLNNKPDWRAEFIAKFGEDKFYEMLHEQQEDDRRRREAIEEAGEC